MHPVLLNVSIAGCHPFPALLHDGRVLALAWWNNSELREIESVEQLIKRGWLRADDTLSGTATIATHAGQSTTFAPMAMLDTYAAEIADFIGAVRGEPGVGADARAGIAVASIIESAVATGKTDCA